MDVENSTNVRMKSEIESWHQHVDPLQMYGQLLLLRSDRSNSPMPLSCVLRLHGNLQKCCACLFIGKPLLSLSSSISSYHSVSHNICLSQRYWLLTLRMSIDQPETLLGLFGFFALRGGPTRPGPSDLHINAPYVGTLQILIDQRLIDSHPVKKISRWGLQAGR